MWKKYIYKVLYIYPHNYHFQHSSFPPGDFHLVPLSAWKIVFSISCKSSLLAKNFLFGNVFILLHLWRILLLDISTEFLVDSFVPWALNISLHCLWPLVLLVRSRLLILLFSGTQYVISLLCCQDFPSLSTMTMMCIGMDIWDFSTWNSFSFLDLKVMVFIKFAKFSSSTV